MQEVNQSVKSAGMGHAAPKSTETTEKVTGNLYESPSLIEKIKEVVGIENPHEHHTKGTTGMGHALPQPESKIEHALALGNREN